MNRRSFLRIGGLGLVGAAITSCKIGGGGGKGKGMGSFSLQPSLNTGVFSRPFFTPLELAGVVDPLTGALVYDLSMQRGTMQFTGQGVTQTMGINSPYLAPTIRISNGDTANFNVANNLGQETTLHWHGMRPPSDMDGGPHQKILNGNVWGANYTINQRASTNWYHPHAEGITAPQVYAGLAGMIIVDDTETLALDLPKTYGSDDFPIVLQDRDMNPDGTFAYSATQMEIVQGKKGNTHLVNGVIDPLLSVPAKEVRLRLLNGSNSRIYRLSFSSRVSFNQIATEQGLLSSPVQLTSITLSPGERTELVFDFTGLVGQSVDLRDDRTGISLMSFNVVANTLPVTTTPAILSTTLTPLLRSQAVRTRSFVLSMSQGNFYINNKQMDMARIDETMVFNDVEILDIQNTSNMDHNFHIHGVSFQILTRNSGSPYSYETGLKDTVFLPANSRVEVIVKYGVRTVVNNPYMYHCHILEHEDAGMMGQFEVV